jgi:hypothetical protein
MKITGLEAVKAGSLTTAARENIKHAYELIVADDRKKLIAFKEEYHKEFKKLRVEDITIPKTCNNLNDYASDETIWARKNGKGGVPFHVRGSLLYNHLLRKHDLKTYPEIKDGEKVKIVYLREPNSVQSNAIAFPNILPTELDLHQYVDYDTQFEKAFIDPVTTVMDAIGWKWEETHTLDAFFV